MFAKQLDKINSLLSNTKTEAQTANDSASLISRNMARTTLTASSRTKRQLSIHSQKVVFHKEQLPAQLEAVLRNLFRAKCKDMEIEYNSRSWELFARTFSLKNKMSGGELIAPVLNLANANLGPSCVSHLNSLIEISSFTAINLTKNILDPTKIRSLTRLKQITLNNCRLGNDALDCLFQQLMESEIESISLSSHQIKDRNRLTRYGTLILLVRHSKTLATLQLGNIQIQPGNGIMEASRNSGLKHLDLSDNSDVKGICPTLLSLNLAKNGITAPFQFPMTPCLLQSLDLSYNKIPYFHFKSFLKNIYFPNLQHLNLDHLNLNGPVQPIQQFVEQSLSLRSLSLVECDLSADSYPQMAMGVRCNKSLRFVDLSRNRVTQVYIAECLSMMLQGGSLTHLRMRHCDMKDNIGALIFKDLKKGTHIEIIDMSNNLLGDQTAKTICRQLKKAKSILVLRLDQNIIKYKDQGQIESYLRGNRHLGRAHLDINYRQLHQINRQQDEADRRLREEEHKASQLLSQTDELQSTFYHKFKIGNEEKRQHLINDIYKVREQETELQQELFVRETMVVGSLHMTRLCHKSSDYDNPEFDIPSPMHKRVRPTD